MALIANVKGKDGRLLSPRTRVHVHAVTSKAFATAVEWQVISTNPVRDAKRPKVEQAEMQPPTNAQLLAMLDGARGTQWEMPLVLAITTDARRSEVLALRWSDVDLAAGRVHISRSLQQLGTSVYFDEPKTKRARRSIALPELALEHLRAQRKAQAERRLLVGSAWQRGDLVCEDGKGSPLMPDSFSQWYRREAIRLGFTSKRLHDVRHAYATTLLAQGVQPAVTSAALGHAQPSFTMATYQHVLDTMTGSAAEAMDAALANRLHAAGE